MIIIKNSKVVLRSAFLLFVFYIGGCANPQSVSEHSSSSYDEGLSEKIDELTATEDPVRSAWTHVDKIIDLQENPSKKGGIDIEDRVLIEEMFARYGVAFDELRLNVVSSLFTDDVYYEILYASKDKVIVKAEGLEDLLSAVDGAWKQLNDQRRHHLTNVVLEKVDDKNVKAIAYGIVVIPGQPNVLAATAVYSADVVLVESQWKFSKFIIATDAYQGR